LLAQDHAQQIDVVVVELAIAAGGALGVDEALALEEPDLGDGDVGNSSSSSPSTSPMERYGRSCMTTRSAVSAIEEDETELADLQLVALVQDDLVVDRSALR
jgi:hypothetical protein